MSHTKAPEFVYSGNMCANCSAPLYVRPGDGKLFCKSCGSNKPRNKFDKK